MKAAGLGNCAERRRAAHLREEAAMAKARAPKAALREVSVDSPYGRADNGVDRVHRVVDTIAAMLARRQISARQETAARKVQAAVELAPASVRCALAASAGGGGWNASPSEAQLWAGGVLNEVRRLLGARDAKVVLFVCGQGFSVEQTARSLFAVADHIRVPRMDLDEIGRRLRGGLDDLADAWWPQKRRRAFVDRGIGAKPAADPAQRPGKSGRKTIDEDVVAHVRPARAGRGNEPVANGRQRSPVHRGR